MDQNKIKFEIIILLIYVSIKYFYIKRRKKVGVIGLDHSQNVGNNLVKYAMFIKLSELGYTPTIIGKRSGNSNISFIQNSVDIQLIQNFSAINENDFDILMVNSDQTWRKWDKTFYDVAFLKFAEHWNKTKFTYATSFGIEIWEYNKEDENIAKNLLKDFTGLSVREVNDVKLIEKYLGFKAQFVLDPTFLIDKKYYLNLIKNFKSEILTETNNNNFIFVYILIYSKVIQNYLQYVESKLKLKIFFLNIFKKNQVQEFLYGIINCKAVITDSFHGTVFSIIFNKPFISFQSSNIDSRFNSLDEIFKIRNRIVNSDSFPSISLLNQPLFINKAKLISLKKQSVNYLKRNLKN